MTVAVVVVAVPRTSERMSEATVREERNMEIPPETDRRWKQARVEDPKNWGERQKLAQNPQVRGARTLRC
jgi:hypothetical protein